jgi:hypothetical protein
MQGKDGLVTSTNKFDLKMKGMDQGREIATGAPKRKITRSMSWMIELRV